MHVTELIWLVCGPAASIVSDSVNHASPVVRRRMIGSNKECHDGEVGLLPNYQINHHAKPANGGLKSHELFAYVCELTLTWWSLVILIRLASRMQAHGAIVDYIRCWVQVQIFRWWRWRWDRRAIVHWNTFRPRPRGHFRYELGWGPKPLGPVVLIISC